MALSTLAPRVPSPSHSPTACGSTRSLASTATTSSSSSHSSKHTRSAGVPELPATVAWLANTTFELTATASKKFAACSTAEYALHVTYRDAAHRQSLTWHVRRSFDEYVEFQQRLLQALALGHACSAECKWLHSFVKNYFPKKARFFGNCSTRTMHVRREKLTRCLHVLQASLLNRGNHSCGVVVHALAGELEAFVHGASRFALIQTATTTRSRASSSASDASDDSERVRRCSIGSSVSTSSTDAGDHANLTDLANVCDLCDDSLDDALDQTTAATGVRCHTTTLSCGHQFHDACVLPELAALNYCCPSCNAPQVKQQ